MNDHPAFPKSLCHKFLAIIALTWGLHSSVAAAVIAQWNFAAPTEPGNQVATAVDAVITGMAASTITRGTGVAAAPASGSMSSNGWTLATTIDPDDYYEFSVTVPTGGQLALTDIAFAERRSGTGIINWEMRSSLDNYGAAIGSPVTVLVGDTTTRDQVVTLPVAFSTLTAGTVTFRLYGYAATGAGGTWRIANHSTQAGLVINGTFIPGSPPGTFTLAFTPPAIIESAGTAATSGKLTRSGATTDALTVGLVNSDPTEISLPATVVIPAGASFVDFPVDAVNDLLRDGPQTVTVTATALNYVNVSQTITVNDDGDNPPLIINEVLADPIGDANGDGVVSGTDDEFVELLNVTNADLDISDWKIYDSNNAAPRHIFPANTILPARSAVVIFGGGTPTGTFGGALVAKASDVNKLSLNNNGDTVTVRNATGDALAFMSYTDLGVTGSNNGGKSLNLDPDVTGTARVQHTVVAGAVGDYSPGAKVDGTYFTGGGPQTYATWIAAAYPGSVDPLVIGFNADPDGDNIPNGAEYAFATLPNAPNGSPLITVPNNTPGRIELNHRRAKGLPASVTISYQWSPDCINWYAAGVADPAGNAVTIALGSVNTSNPSYDVVTVLATIAEGNLTKFFVRTKVNGP